MNQTAETVRGGPFALLRKISRMRCAKPAKVTCADGHGYTDEPCGRCATCIAREFFKEYEKRRDSDQAAARGCAGAACYPYRRGGDTTQEDHGGRRKVEKKLVWRYPVGTKVAAVDDLNLYLAKRIEAGTVGVVCKLGPRLRPRAETYMVGPDAMVPVKFPGLPSFWAGKNEVRPV